MHYGLRDPSTRRRAVLGTSRKHFTVRVVSFHLNLGDSAFPKKVLDAFGKDVFGGIKDVAIVRGPCHRPRHRIFLAAIVASFRVFAAGRHLIGER